MQQPVLNIICFMFCSPFSSLFDGKETLGRTKKNLMKKQHLEQDSKAGWRNAHKL